MSHPIKIDGHVVSQNILLELTRGITQLKGIYQQPPGLAVILVGDDPGSKAYVGRKKKACEQIGIRSFEYLLPATTSEQELVTLIQCLNHNPDVHGILLQSPVPKHLNEQLLLDLIDPKKDVDGFHPVNVGRLLLGLDTFRSCTPWGIMELLARYEISTQGKHVVIVGRSNIVGKPMAAMLIQKEANATVTICHSQTRDMKSVTNLADILIVAIGKPKFITAEYVREGAVVIDVGMNRILDPTTKTGTRLVGDVDFDSVAPKSSLITPVPGGVGPMTIAMLMKNTVKAYQQFHS